MEPGDMEVVGDTREKSNGSENQTAVEWNQMKRWKKLGENIM